MFWDVLLSWKGKKVFECLPHSRLQEGVCSLCQSGAFNTIDHNLFLPILPSWFWWYYMYLLICPCLCWLFLLIFLCWLLLNCSTRKCWPVPGLCPGLLSLLITVLRWTHATQGLYHLHAIDPQPTSPVLTPPQDSRPTWPSHAWSLSCPSRRLRLELPDPQACPPLASCISAHLITEQRSRRYPWFLSLLYLPHPIHPKSCHFFP